MTIKETAQAVRKTLKAQYAGTKFGVTSKMYTGGGSVYVTWQDGPSHADIAQALAKFQSPTRCICLEHKMTALDVIEKADRLTGQAATLGLVGDRGKARAQVQAARDLLSDLVAFGTGSENVDFMAVSADTRASLLQQILAQ